LKVFGSLKKPAKSFQKASEEFSKTQRRVFKKPAKTFQFFSLGLLFSLLRLVYLPAKSCKLSGEGFVANWPWLTVLLVKTKWVFT
jgi:hypothetical protein